MQAHRMTTALTLSPAVADPPVAIKHRAATVYAGGTSLRVGGSMGVAFSDRVAAVGRDRLAKLPRRPGRFRLAVSL